MAGAEQSGISEIATAIGVVLGACSLVVGVVNAHRDQKAKRLEREAVALQTMNARYQQMADIRRPLNDRTQRGEEIPEAEIYSFYAGYWTLLIDQWEHYRLGVISKDVYVTWLSYVFDTLAGFHKIGTLNSRESWEKIGRSLSRNNVEFRLLMEQMYEKSQEKIIFLDKQSKGGAPIDRLKLRAMLRKIIDATPLWVRSSLTAKQRRLIEKPMGRYLPERDIS